ncbi:MAG: UPF0182 family protein, partial [Rhodococcus sp. (in: high G+C Gram-positive bacteria)]|uniref:UPF0182 family protein n=1 Tax=Rhodococcus sp. TaxID=1831 RepID=UPI003BAE8EB0
MQPAERVQLLSRRATVWTAALFAFAVLLVAGPRMIGVYTDWLWFGEVGYRRVWGTILITRLLLFTIVTALVWALVFSVLLWAYRSRPLFATAVSEKDPIEEYRTVVMSRPRLFVIGIPLLLALPFGLSAQSRWDTVQLFLRGGSFGTVDAEFGHDIGFYVFDLPFYRLVLTWLLVAVFLAFLVSLGTHYLFGGIRLSLKDKSKGRETALIPAARIQLAILAGTFIALKAVAYWFDRYSL